ncbi:MAG: MMPL family transporter [Thermodesulfobacteriota bacterium]
MDSGNNSQQGLVPALSRAFEKIGSWSYDHRILVLLICIAVLGACAWLSRNVRFDNSFEAYFDRSDPTYQDFLRFRDDFGSDEIAYILYEEPGSEDGVWDLSVMEKISRLTDALEKEVPFIKRVRSLANAEFIEGVDGELRVHDLLDPFPESREELLVLRGKVLSRPLFVGGLASADGKYGAIILEMEKASIDPLEELRADPSKGDAMDNLYPQAPYDAIEKVLARPEFKPIVFHHTGDVPLNANYNRISSSESQKLGLISFAVIGLFLGFFFRRPMGVFGPLAVVLFSILVATGFVGLMGWSFDLMFVMLPATLVAVGVADSVHVLAEYTGFLHETGDRKRALARTLYLVGVPCLFTSLTTVAGFSSMAVSPIKAIRHFALYSAVGVGAAFLLTVSLFVVFLSLGKRTVSEKTWLRDQARAKGGTITHRILGWVSRFDIRHRKGILACSLAIFVFCAIGMTRLVVDSNFMNEFSPKLPIRQTTHLVDSVMGGAGSFSYVFDAGETDGIIEPAMLSRIESLQGSADRESILVMKTGSIVDLLKDINRSLHDEDPAWYRLPETREAAAQYLLLYEMSGGDELSEYLSSDRQRANLEVRCKMAPSSHYKNTIENLETVLDAQGGQGQRPTVTGMGALWIRLIDYIVSSQIWGFLLAFAVIAVMMCVVFGSLRLGLLSMIPNLAPVVVTLGIMGWTGITLDYVKLLIACIAIGIAVDDTVHLVTRFRHFFYAAGRYETALTRSVTDVGRALFITTAVLVAGFAVFIFSDMHSIATFGLLTAGTLITALAADFFLMPALLLVFRPMGAEPGEQPGA